MKKNVLVLANDIKRYLGDTDQGILEVYQKVTGNVFLRGIRKIALATKIGALWWLADWKKDVGQYDTIILFDTGNADYLIEILHTIAPKARLILWYWNAVEKTIPVNKIDRDICEIWSYNKRDCERYGLKYNTQFYCQQNQWNGTEHIEQDVYFAGADKGRTEMLYQLKEKFVEENITYKFILTAINGSQETKIEYSKPITPQENIDNIQHSKVIIDIVDSSQLSGFTMRPFEAAFYHKKIITNDPNVRNLLFYSSANFFVWGVDDDNRLKEFVDSEFVPIPGEKLAYYHYAAWLERFEDLNLVSY